MSMRWDYRIREAGSESLKKQASQNQTILRQQGFIMCSTWQALLGKAGWEVSRPQKYPRDWFSRSQEKRIRRVSMKLNKQDWIWHRYIGCLLCLQNPSTRTPYGTWESNEIYSLLFHKHAHMHEHLTAGSLNPAIPKGSWTLGNFTSN